MTTYLRAKEAEARRAAELEAARLAAEAERLESQALRTGELAEVASSKDLKAAEEASELANARALELTRTRVLGGALTALKDNWVWSLEDITKVPHAPAPGQRRGRSAVLSNRVPALCQD